MYLTFFLLITILLLYYNYTIIIIVIVVNYTYQLVYVLQNNIIQIYIQLFMAWLN